MSVFQIACYHLAGAHGVVQLTSHHRGVVPVLFSLRNIFVVW